MRVIALEEHISFPALAKTIDPAAIAKRGHFKGRNLAPGKVSPMELLPETGERRLKSMDDAGITMHVLSNSGASSDLVPGPDGIALTKKINDNLADVVTKNPKRFAAFAQLPMAAPEACADELRRAVKDLKLVGAMIHGTCDGRFLDDPSYDSLLAAAVELDVPIYIHPNVPSLDVQKAYYGGMPEGADRVLATAAWGWHSEVAIHILRMVFAGTFDKHPKLKMIIGHMGEMLPVMLARLDDVAAGDAKHLQRAPSRTIVDQVWITTSGIFTQPPFVAALQTFGIDRIMFSVDYPFAQDAQGRKFLDEVALAPTDMEKLCYGNADALLKLKA